jgi:hypothetical protein
MALLFYVDESGDEHHHLHLGVLADGDQTACAETALNQLCVDVLSTLQQAVGDDELWTTDLRHLPAHDVELHAYEIVAGEKLWGRLSVEQRIDVMDRILAIFASCGVEVVYRGTAIPNFKAHRGITEDPHRLMFSNLLERLNERSKARGQRSLVIADQNHDKDVALRQALTTGQRSGTIGYRGQVFTHVIDTVHFVDSKLSRMVQLADAAAFIVRKHVGPGFKDDRARAVIERQAQVVYNAVPDPKGQYGTIWRPN